MTSDATGASVCDRCGVSVGGGSIFDAVTISDLDPANNGLIVNLHLCRVGKDGAKGCAGRVLTKAALKDWHDRRSAEPARSVEFSPHQPHVTDADDHEALDAVQRVKESWSEPPEPVFAGEDAK